MSIRIGLYDFFAYTIPGVFYLVLTGYWLSAFELVKIDVNILNNLSTLSLVLGIGAGYIAGLLLDPFAYKWMRLFYKRNSEATRSAYEEFQSQHRWLDLNFLPADWGILLRSVKSKSIEVATDIEQHNVASIMLRNIGFGLMIFSVGYLLFFFIMGAYIWNLVLSGIFFLLSIVAYRRSNLRRHWFYLAVFEAFLANCLPQERWFSEKKLSANRTSKTELHETETLTSASVLQTKPAEE